MYPVSTGSVSSFRNAFKPGLNLLVCSIGLFSSRLGCESKRVCQIGKYITVQNSCINVRFCSVIKLIINSSFCVNKRFRPLLSKLSVAAAVCVVFYALNKCFDHYVNTRLHECVCPCVRACLIKMHNYL